MIKLLPDNVANQIAAGEVVQRPASVVKELLENAIDAGSDKITLIIKDSGRTLIQVIDNGSGMSEIDARLCFERHATSKIKTANDLERITTFGFRGEALASISAVAEVELKTRRSSEDLGCRIVVQSSNVTKQEVVQCPVGSNFSVKNLFYNIPARRKFLKSDAVELKHIISEFQRVSICNPEIEFIFINNNNQLYNLYKGNLRQRLMSIFNKSINNSLIDVNIDTPMIKISGFIGKPETARKTMSEQFFFVNNRFFRSAYFQKAVFKAYDQLLPAETYPSFFLFFEINPSRIDVNIHPSKTEIKFDEEQGIWQILNAIVRESLSRFAVTPSIIFDTEGAIDIPVLTKDTDVKTPTVKIDTSYNPFNNDGWDSPSTKGWENLYNALEKKSIEISNTPHTQKSIEDNLIIAEKRFLQVKGKYILTPVKSGVMVIDIYRAHQRILYDKFINLIENKQLVSQKELYPQSLELDPADYILIQSVVDKLNLFGFDIRCIGNNTIVFYAFPVGFEDTDIRVLIEEILRDLRENHRDMEIGLRENLALSLARAEALRHSRNMQEEEMQDFVDQLFACSSPNLSADGKIALSIITMEELENRLQK